MGHIVICALPSCSLRTEGRTDRQTDMTKLIFVIINFANAPQNGKILNNMQRAHVGGVTVYIVM